MIKKVASITLVVLLMTLSLSVTGCSNNTKQTPSSPTATPTAQKVTATPLTTQATATPAPAAGFNPLLATLESKLKSQYAANKMSTKELPNNASHVMDELLVSVSLPNGDNLTASFRNYSSLAAATNFYEMMAKEDPTTNGPANPTYFGQDAVKAALGHSPTVVKDTALLLEAGGAPPTPVDYEVIQYDTLVVTINHIWPNSGA